MARSTEAFRSRRVVTPDGVVPATVLVEGGRISGLASYDSLPAGSQLHDFGDLVLMAGLVDSHVHVNEPGRTEWEGYRTATQAAASGGITTLVDMPLNSSPVTTTLAALEKKLESTHEKLWVDTGFWGGVVPGNTRELASMVKAGVFGFKCFLVHSGIDDFPNVSEGDLRDAMPALEKLGVPLLVHAELDREGAPCGRPASVEDGGTAPVPRSPAGREGSPSVSPVVDPRAYESFLASRPHRWEVEAIELMARLCRETRCPVHVVHLSSAEALPVVTDAREEGLPLTIETCPHYLTLKAEEIAPGDTRYKCAPPIREDRNRDGLWRALLDGVVDFVVSDHSPCPPQMKLLEQGDFFGAWGGISSLQLGLSTTWTEARRRGFGFLDVSRWLSQRPAAFLGLADRKGKIAPGFDADFTIWDPDVSWEVVPDLIRHRHKLTPYEGRRLFGAVKQTIVRGKTAFRDGEVSQSPQGAIILNQRGR